MQAALLISVVVTFNIVFLYLLIRRSRGISKYLTLSLIIFNLSLLSWQICLIIIRFLQDTDFLHRIAFVASLGAVYSSLNISLLYPKKVASTNIRIGMLVYGLFNLAIILLILGTNSIISGYRIETLTVEFTILGNIFLVYLAVNLIIVIFNFASRYLNEKKSRFYFRYAFIGIIFYGLAAFIFNLILPGILGITEFSLIGSMAAIIPQFAILYSLTTTRPYTIKYILGNISFILVRTGIYYLVFYIVASVEIRMFDSIFAKEAYIVGVFIAIGFSVITIYLEKYIKRYFKSYILYNNSLTPDEARSELAKKIANELDIDKIVKQVINVIFNNFKVNGLGIFIYQWEDNKEISKFSEGIVEISDIENLKVGLEKLIKMKREVILFKELDTIRLEDSELSFFKDTMNSNEIEAIVSIYRPDEYFGYLAIKGKLNEEPLTKEDIDLLKKLIESLTLDISKSLLYKRVQDFNLILNNKIEEATRELKKRNDELAESLRKERDMMDILGHELRTPLSIARNASGFLDMELEKITSDSAPKALVKENNNKILENLRREVKILETVLSSTQIENEKIQLEITSVDFNDVVNDSIEGLKDLATKKNIDLKVDMPSEIIYCKADRAQTQRIVDNLIENAIKYTSEGSVTVKLEKDGDMVRLSVIDTGEGIPAEDIPKLGRKFFRSRMYLDSTNNNTLKVVRPGGTGIGLYVVFNLIKLMSGKIDIQSVVDKGSVFTVWLPQSSPQ